MGAKALLGEFFTDSLKLIDTRPDFIACPEIIRNLCAVLRNPDTEKAIPCNTKPERTTLYERQSGFTILGHHHPNSVHSQPHDHGRTWAIYGVVTGKTAMYEYEIIEPGKNGKKGKVKLTKSYWIFPGQACWYPVGSIHSHKTYDDTKLIRLEGMNIWRKENRIGGRSFEMIA